MAAAHRLGRLGGEVADDRVEAAVATRSDSMRPESPRSARRRSGRRLRRLWAYEDARAAVREQVAEPAALRRQLAGHGLDWLRLEGRRLRLPSEDAAREARALMTDDGLGAEEVAAIAGTVATADSLYLEEIAGQVAGALAAAVPGDVSPPWLQDDRVERARGDRQDAAVSRGPGAT